MPAAAAAPAAATPATFALDALSQPIDLPIPEDEDKAIVRVPRPSIGLAAALVRRNPRLAAGAAFVAMILVGLLLLGGGKPAPSAIGATASPTAPAIVPVAADPGAASLVLTGSLKATYTLTGDPGQSVANNTVAAKWADPLQSVLTLDGAVDRGTRTTDAGLVLTWGLMVDGKLVTFTSKAGECTIGMASIPGGVTGSFACHKIKSDDGKLTVGATGTYRT